MKNKKFDTVKKFRSIRDENYEKTKELSQKELLERYKKRGQAALDHFKKTSKNSNDSG